MQTTNKFNEIFRETEKPQAANNLPGTLQKVPLIEKRDRDVIATEIKSMIAKAFTDDEPNNQQQEK